MAKRKTETLDDLLRPWIDSERLTEWCIEHRIEPRTVHRLRNGQSSPRLATLLMLATALGVPEARVLAAIKASRDRSV